MLCQKLFPPVDGSVMDVITPMNYVTDYLSQHEYYQQKLQSFPHKERGFVAEYAV